MAIHDPIAPFPAEIDRNDFGFWLSGFVDGEGCFQLRQGRGRIGCAVFTIGLRCDDRPVLELIRSYWQCGSIDYNGHTAIPNGKPVSTLRITRRSDLFGRIIPHFLRYPLRAKKARDFEVWRQAVEFSVRVGRKKCPGLGPGHQGGKRSNWSSQDLEHFEDLMRALKEVRRYQGSISQIPCMKPSDMQLSLW